MQQNPGAFKHAARAAQQTSGATRVERDGIVVHEFPDYETYRNVQIAGNKAKLKKQFVKESHIQALAEHLNRTCGKTSFGICHGTRRGLEQEWFRQYLTGDCDVIGTEISDTASQFPNTTQWDFHDENPEWQARADFVYSNAWDHAVEPGRAFSSWARSTRIGGLILLDHTRRHAPKAANALDPFGATLNALCDFLNQTLSEFGEVSEILDRSDAPDYRAKVVIWRRNK